MKVQVLIKIQVEVLDPTRASEKKQILESLEQLWHDRIQENLAVDGGHSQVSVEAKKIKSEED
jgi:hypothetical protein